MSEYNVGDKFAIEIKELVNGSNGEMFYKSDCCSIIFGEEQLDKLQKYNGSTISEDTLEMVRMKALNDGRNDAWELASKIVLDVSKGGIPERDMRSMFGEKWTVSDILENYTPQEALAKLEAYEKEQNEIKAGYVYEIMGKFCAVVQVDEFNNEYHVIWCDGCTDRIPFETPIGFKKTGKHIDIQSILQQIGGTE